MELLTNALNWTSLLLRIILGIVFIVHGYPKFKNFTGTKDFVKSLGFPFHKFFSFMLSFAEFIGAIMLLFGFATRIFLVLLFISMSVAFYFNAFAWKKGFASGYELDLVLLACIIALFLLGAGSYSVDSMIGWILG